MIDDSPRAAQNSPAHSLAVNIPTSAKGLSAVLVAGWAMVASSSLHAQSLTIQNPDLSVTFCKSQVIPIRWVSKGVGAEVKVELLKGRGVYKVIAARQENTGSMDWKIPKTMRPATNLKIRISGIGRKKGVRDTSAESFTIVKEGGNCQRCGAYGEGALAKTALQKRNYYACEIKRSPKRNPYPGLEAHPSNHGAFVDLFADGDMEFYTNGDNFYKQPEGTVNRIYSFRKTRRVPKVKMVWLRKAAVADINRDGRDDLFLLGHGWDEPPYPGEHSRLLLSKGKKRYRSADPRIGIGFWHGGSVGDLNNDGRPDLLATTTGVGTNSVALQRRNGTFTLKTFMPAGDSPQQLQVVASEIFDADGDGNNDIVVSANFGSEIRVFWGDGSGSFNVYSSVAMPGSFVHVVDINAGDFNGDGRTQIALLATQDRPNFYVGYAVHILDLSGRELQTPRAIATRANSAWFPWIYVWDLNADGKDDIFSTRIDLDLDRQPTGEKGFLYYGR